MVYIGVDACKAGWFAVVLAEGTNWKADIFPDISSLWNQYKDAKLILIDIPIGLLENEPSERSCDIEARKLLGPKRRSSVFPVPCRNAVHADVTEASNINKRLTGRKLSKQVFGIIPKIRQVDQLLLADMTARSHIRETHPELCFRALNSGKPMKYSKKKEKEKAFLERMEVLLSVYPYTNDVVNNTLTKYPPTKVAKDDILDALVAAVTASEERRRLSSIPKTTEVDSKGLPMEMVYSTWGHEDNK